MEVITYQNTHCFHAVFLGGPNLHVNVSVEFTGETFHSDLLNRGSQMFFNKTTWLENQVSTSALYCLIITALDRNTSLLFCL